jgi:hypothetical protein
VTISRNALIIIAAVLVVAVVAFLAVRPGGFLNPNTSLTGTWYGTFTVSGLGNGTITYEAFGSFQQTNSTLTGTANLCVDRGGSADVSPTITLNGTADGTKLSLTLSGFGDGSTTTGTYSVSSGTASGQGFSADGQERATWTLAFQSGTEAQFRTACAQLPVK